MQDKLPDTVRWHAAPPTEPGDKDWREPIEATRLISQVEQAQGVALTNRSRTDYVREVWFQDRGVFESLIEESLSKRTPVGYFVKQCKDYLESLELWEITGWYRQRVTGRRRGLTAARANDAARRAAMDERARFAPAHHGTRRIPRAPFAE